MKQLITNIVTHFGQCGENWLAQLPNIIAILSKKWQLRECKPVDNMTFNYVAKASDERQVPMILKISCDPKGFQQELNALSFFNGKGSIQLLAFDQDYQALLLQQAVPGLTLKHFYPHREEYAMDCYIRTMHQLHTHAPPYPSSPHVSEWLEAIDRLDSNSVCSSTLLNKTHTVKMHLLTSMTNEYFLHGDLHHDNILLHGNDWLAIDPKGVMGEAEFEIAAFDFLYIDNLVEIDSIKALLKNKVNLLAKKSHLDAERISDWILVRLMLMAAWQVEDNINPHWTIKLAEKLI